MNANKVKQLIVNPQVLKMLAKADPYTLRVWPLLDMETLPTWVDDRLAINLLPGYIVGQHDSQGNTILNCHRPSGCTIWQEGMSCISDNCKSVINPGGIFKEFNPQVLKMLAKADPYTLRVWPLLDMETLPTFASFLVPVRRSVNRAHRVGMNANKVKQLIVGTRVLIKRQDALEDPETRSLAMVYSSVDMWDSDEKRVVIYPCANNELLNFVCIHPECKDRLLPAS
jgi:ribosomal protein L30/L7E